MEIIEVEGVSQADVVKRFNELYGRRGKLIKVESREKGGFLGFFTKKVYIGDVLINHMDDFSASFRSHKNEGLTSSDSFKKEQKKILETISTDKFNNQIAKKIDEIYSHIKEGNSSALNEHASISEVRELLLQNDFSDIYIQEIIDKVQKNFSVNDLNDFDLVRSKVYGWIEESICIDEIVPSRIKRQNVTILIGPTGVGKTTTIAKMSAHIVVNLPENASPSMALFTIDTYRIAAQEQLETYGKILNVPVETIKDKADLEKKLLLYHFANNILIDTIGRSPHDSEGYYEMKETLDGCQNEGTVYLVISASTKTRDMINMLNRFELFNYRSIILTKVDETSSIGNIISVLKEKGKKISYVTTGQDVSQDFEKASRKVLLEKLIGFKQINKNFKNQQGDRL